jgi:predicted transcriptional regulator
MKDMVGSGNVIIMKQPFEGLFGDTCETRLLQFLLPMYGIEFDMADLTEEIKLTRQSISKAMKKFSDKGMVKIRKDGRTWLYSINEESPLVKRLEDFDNSLIESMVGAEEFEKIQQADSKRVRIVHLTEEGFGKSKIESLRQGSFRDEVRGVASRDRTYRTKKD